MSRFPMWFAAAVLALGSAHGGTIIVTNTFISGQTPVAGGPGPVAPTFGISGVNANGVHALGITFAFSDTAGETYGAPVGLGAIDRGLQGPADTSITLTFDSPSTFLSFDIFLGLFANSGGSVTIGGIPRPFTTIGSSNSPSLGSFSSGTLSPFTAAQITFNSTPPGTLYAIGNLSYDATTITAPESVPEPGSLTLFAAGSLLLGTLVRVRRSTLPARNRP